MRSIEDIVILCHFCFLSVFNFEILNIKQNITVDCKYN